MFTFQRVAGARNTLVLICAFGLGHASLRADGPKAPLPSPVRESFDVRYHPGGDRQLLDVFQPKAAGKYPVLIFAHGGAWMFGDKNFFGLYRGAGTFLARNGIVAVLVNYRLSPAVKHPEHVRDLARAFTWVRKNIEQYDGDPERIILAGHSAGAHLVALLATDDSLWKDPKLGLEPADRQAIKGAIAISGVYRIPAANETTAMIAELLGGVRNGGAPVRPAGPPRRGQDFKLFQIVFGDDGAIRSAASPVNHVRKGLPPFLLVCAERELPMLPEMAREFGKALRSCGNSVEEVRIPRCHHNDILFRLKEKDDPTARAILDFVRRNAEPTHKSSRGAR